MPAKDLGTKHTCYKCATKFYDLKKPELICPKCGADQRDSPALKAPTAAERRSRAAGRPAPEPAPAEVEIEEADLEDEEEGEEDTAEEAAEADDEG